MKRYQILSLVPHYTTFIKDSIEATADYVASMEVIIYRNRLTEFSRYLPQIGPIPHIRKFSKNQLIEGKGIPSNININFNPLIYIMPDASNIHLGDRLFQKISIDSDFDLIHSHFIWPMGYVGSKIKQKNDKPLVITAHGFDIYDLPFRNDNWGEIVKETLCHAEQIILVTMNNKKFINKLGINRPIEIIPNGFRDDVFYPKNSKKILRKNGIPDDKRIILTVGSLSEVKGHRYLIDAAKEILKEEDAIFIIIGSGPLLGELKKRAMNLGIKNRIFFIGQRPHYEISEWMNACDVFVLPSLNEGNPTVMFEVLGCGKPFVGTNVGGISEIIISDEYGLLVEPANVADLSENIIYAIRREWNEEKILEYAKQFTWNNISKKIVDVYNQIL